MTSSITSLSKKRNQRWKCRSVLRSQLITTACWGVICRLRSSGKSGRKMTSCANKMPWCWTDCNPLSIAYPSNQLCSNPWKLTRVKPISEVAPRLTASTRCLSSHSSNDKNFRDCQRRITNWSRDLSMQSRQSKFMKRTSATLKQNNLSKVFRSLTKVERRSCLRSWISFWRSNWRNLILKEALLLKNNSPVYQSHIESSRYHKILHLQPKVSLKSHSKAIIRRKLPSTFILLERVRMRLRLNLSNLRPKSHKRR